MIGEAEKERLHVGYKQAVRALNENKAEKIYIAQDCDEHIKSSLGKAAKDTNTPIVFINTMKELGNMCSIEVGASCAVILK